MSNEISILAAVISALVALMALYYTRRATSIAQKSLAIVEQQELRRAEKLSIYLVGQSFKKSFREQKLRVYAFHIQISNKSDSDNSIKDIQLIVEVHGKNNFQSTIVLHNSPKLIELIPKLDSEILPSSFSINANSVLNGYALFQLPYEPIEKAELDSYLLKIIDVHGNETQLDSIFINEWQEK